MSDRTIAWLSIGIGMVGLTFAVLQTSAVKGFCLRIASYFLFSMARRQKLNADWHGIAKVLLGPPNMPKDSTFTYQLHSGLIRVTGIAVFKSPDPSVPGEIRAYLKGSFLHSKYLLMEYEHDVGIEGLGCIFLTLSGNAMSMHGYCVGWSIQDSQKYIAEISLHHSSCPAVDNAKAELTALSLGDGSAA